MLGNRYVVAVVGVILALVVVYNIKFFASKQGSPQPGVTPAMEMVESLVHGAEVIPERITSKQDDRKWRHDPFHLQSAAHVPVKIKKTEGGLHLTGIIKRDGRSLALINGSVYAVNDRIGNALITGINRDSIIVMTDGRKREISLID